MRRQRGVALIIALGAVALLMGIVATVVTTQHYRLLARQNRIQKREATIAAEAALQRAFVDFESINVNKVTLVDDWATETEQADKRYIVGNMSFRYEIIDASSLLNVNTVTETQLETLNLTSEQIDSLLDWREAATTSTRLEGAKDEYYNNLVNPYNTKLGAFDSVDELLLVKGFLPSDVYELQTNTTSTTPELPLYLLMTADSTAPNTTASGSTKLNPSTATIDQMTQAGITNQLATRIISSRGRGYSSMADVLNIRGLSLENAGLILENFSLDTSQQLTGRININTAPKSVLETLPNITSDIVDAIISRQSAGFDSLADLSDVSGVTVSLLQEWADLVCIGSQVFIVRAVGTVGRTSVAIEAIVTITDGKASIKKVHRPPYADMETRWNWADQPSTETTLVSND
jgi:type II secretory pathway component PulK